jgi:hypothetical protein
MRRRRPSRSGRGQEIPQVVSRSGGSGVAEVERTFRFALQPISSAIDKTELTVDSWFAGWHLGSNGRRHCSPSLPDANSSSWDFVLVVGD